MRYEIVCNDDEEPVREKSLKVRLQVAREGVRLQVRRPEHGSTWYYIATLLPDGSLHIVGGVPTNLGLDVVVPTPGGAYGKIRVSL